MAGIAFCRCNSWSFRKGSRTAGAISRSCLSACCSNVKLMQFNTMSTPTKCRPTTVTSATVKEEDGRQFFRRSGSISAIQGAIVSTELGGQWQVNFQNGGEAKKGDVLVQLVPLEERSAPRSRLELAEANLARARDLAARKVISKSELDAAESEFEQKKGTVDNMRS